MKRTRAQNPKLQDPQDPSSAAAATPTANTKPQRKAKQPRQPKATATGGKKASAAAAAREAAAVATAAAATSATQPLEEMTPVVPDVCGGGGSVEVAGGLPADWDEMDGGLGANVSPWWTFGVEEEKLLGWFPFVEEDFGGGSYNAGLGGGREAEPAGFDDDIWRIHQIYEIPSYAAK
ncbi:uncharacterized protein LOC124659326 [Lolium rigidum]|uniref:uncharacterized protein LOC124659326 n=1 Tax=Lolium rigidum TaxID=89674 RepID=UPI001F5CAD6C|nr:uncharacterized protein LOC124659326 [Lolium rigidum]